MQQTYIFMKDNSDVVYKVYHIIGKKVGLTCKEESRIVDDQGCRPDEYEILDEFSDLDEALDYEQERTAFYGYKKTPRWHPHMAKQFNYHSGTTITVVKNMGRDLADFYNQEKVTFTNENGDVYNFEGDEVKDLADLIQPGKQYGGGYLVWNKIRNLYEDLRRGSDISPCIHSNEIPEFAQIREWATERGLYDKGDAKTQYLKLQEEAGEVARAILKSDEAEIVDGLGDTLVVLINLAHLAGYKLEDCLASAYDVISKRTGKMINGTFVKTESL